MPVELIAVTDTVHLAHTDLVNWTIVADDTGVMLIDAGFPGSRDEVLTSLRRLGFGPSDVRAILLTHAHVDHFGSAIWFAATHGTPVYCHADEVGHSKREYLQQASRSTCYRMPGSHGGSSGRWRSPARVPWCAPASPPPGL
jgi:glyoxylase-like metal-dependent hydrolase (beta-lactamase superfamily II)